MSEEVSYGRGLTLLAESAGESDVAVIFAAGDRTETVITWRFLEQRANQFAHLLLARDVAPGDLVVIALPNSVDHLVASFGAWKTGATVLPLRSDVPQWERDRVLDLASPVVVVSDVRSDDARTVSLSELAGTVDLDPSPPPDRVPRWRRVIASSGSTGHPKLIVSPTPGTLNPLAALHAAAAGGQRPIQLGASPLYHANGWHGGGPASVLDGNLTVLMERFEADHAVDLIERHRVTTAIFVPTMLMRILRLCGISDRDFSSLERIVYGGASIPEWVVRAWLELIPPERFTFSYGSSEGLGSVRTTGDEWLRRPGTTGRPQTCDVVILDPNGDPRPNGTIGEIYLRPHDPGPSFEYLGAPTPTPTSDGFRTLGDLGWVDDEGYLYIADRRQDMIISGGANVFPAEVEAVLSEHPCIRDQVVIGLVDSEWGHRVHAIVELEASVAPPTTDELRTFCRERIAAYKVPKSIELVAHIPRTPAGKVNRSALVGEREVLAQPPDERP